MVDPGVGARYGHSPLIGECGLSLSLGPRPMKTFSSIQEMTSN